MTKNKNIKKLKPQDDFIDTKVKISGQSIKFQDISPTSINQIKDTKKAAEKIVEENSQEAEEESQGQKNINQIKENIRNQNQQEEIEDNTQDEYLPEVLSATPDEIDYKKSAAAIWITVLLAIIIGLMVVISYWYWEEYVNSSKNEIMSSQTSQSSNSTSLSSKDFRSETDEKITEIELLVQQNDNNPLPEKPEINFDVNF